jgi:16S rRNA (cytosine1402-N4)-methyltransferase
MTTPERSRSLESDPHEPVLAREVVSILAPREDGCYVDCTVGAGGHTRALFEAGAGRVIGIDRDSDALSLAGSRLASWAPALRLVHDDYRHVAEILRSFGIAEVNGVVADLGVS